MSSDDDEVIDPRVAKTTQSTLKSMFATDSRAAVRGSTTLRYEAKSKKERDDEGAPAVAAAAATPAAAAASGTLTAAQATVQVFRGDQAAGPAAIAVVVVNNTAAMIILVDRERRPLCRVRCNADLQLLQNQSSPQYATLYDPAIGQHWTLMFKTATDCTTFVTAASTLLHYIQLADGPVEPYQEVTAASDSRRPAKKGDRVSISMTVWLVHRLGGGNSTFFTVGKVVDEVPADAPKAVKLGTNEVMLGVEDMLVGMGVGCRRLGWLSPKKTRVAGIGNPEINPGDSVVVLVCCHAIQRGGEGGGVMGIDGDSDDGNASEKEDLFDDKQNKKKGRGSKQPAAAGATSLDQHYAQQQQQSSTAVALSSPPPQQQATPPQQQQQPFMDSNALLQTVLLSTLQLQQQVKQQQQQAPPEAPKPSPMQFDVDRGLDRIYQQLFSLSEKFDRLNIEEKLAKNNEAVERMVKKAVGKMPVNDVDMEDMAKDRDQLLAKIEHLKLRVEEATDSYHKALETMGTHKDQVVALKNDLSIERETSAARIRELTERKRLELVDLEVRHRRELDRVKEQVMQEGLEVGYQRGFAAGRIDALQITGSSSMEDTKRLLHEKEQELVEAESRYQQLASKNYQERREMLDQIGSLNSLIKRLEARETGKANTVVDTSSAMCKMLRRAMNSTYASIEAQFYATERETISVEDALAMVLVSVKSETRTFVEEIKRDGALIASAAQQHQHQSDVDAAAGAGGSSQQEVLAAYRISTDLPSSSAEGVAESNANSAATEAYLAMRAEIEEYQRQREAEARDDELRSADNIYGGKSESREQAAAAAAAATGDVDVSSLPLPPFGDEDDSADTLPPPPPLPPHLFSNGDVDEGVAHRADVDEY